MNKSTKAVLIVLIFLILILISAIGFGGYYIYTNVLNKNVSIITNNKEEPKKEDASDFLKIPINDLVLNISNMKGQAKLMKLSFTIKSSFEGLAEFVDTNKPEIVDSIINIVSSKHSEELLTLSGKTLFKEEVIKELDKILINQTGDNTVHIKDILFTSFVIK